MRQCNLFYVLQVSFISAASEAGVTDASTLADMIQYAAHASQVPVKRSGQSAFSWVPLVAVAAFAQGKAAPERRADVLGLTVQALVSVMLPFPVATTNMSVSVLFHYNSCIMQQAGVELEVLVV